MFLTRMSEKYVPGAVCFPNDGHDLDAVASAALACDADAANATIRKAAARGERTGETIEHRIRSLRNARRFHARQAEDASMRSYWLGWRS